MSSRTHSGYSLSQILLHWAVVVLVLFQLAFGEAIETLVDAGRESAVLSSTTVLMGNLHIYAGVLVLLLTLARVVLRVNRGVPVAGDGGRSLADRIAGIVHGAFYGLLLLAPVSGLVAYYALPEMAGIHKLAKPAFLVLIALHVGGALWHQLVRRDGLMRRMVLPEA
jgi:cytochrome b561